MAAAVDEMEMDPVMREELWSYLEMAANSMVNQPD
jgi:truncated hemoglobin YjbI